MTFKIQTELKSEGKNGSTVTDGAFGEANANQEREKERVGPRQFVVIALSFLVCKMGTLIYSPPAALDHRGET